MKNKLTLEEIADLAGKVENWGFYTHVACQGRSVARGIISSSDGHSYLEIDVFDKGQSLSVYFYHNSSTNVRDSIPLGRWKGFDSRFKRIYDLAYQRYEEEIKQKREAKETEEEMREAEILQRIRKQYFQK